MAKVFNVDALAEETREIVLKGTTHAVLPMDVDGFLKTLEVADELEKDKSPEAQVGAVVKMINRAIPTLSAEEIRKLPFHQMNAISAFIRGEVPDELKDAVSTDEAKK